jgi:murein DD-endopeptidase MepM/ murein hydrolase activator NlpD
LHSKFKILFVVFFTLILSNYSVAQLFEKDSLDFEKNNPSDYIPNDLVPAEVLYKQSWDNTNIRIKHSDVFANCDSVQLILTPKNNPKFVSPIVSNVISKYGSRGKSFHSGSDVKCAPKQKIYCAFDGKVRIARDMGAYGNVVVVRHFNGLETCYSHLATIKVRVNENVKAGELIGLGGRTGRATTEHLHFETRYLGEAFNSEAIIDWSTGKLLADTFQLKRKHFAGTQKIQTAQDFIAKEEAKNKPIETVVKKPAPQKVHYVTKGDTLYSIAKRYGTTVAEICSINNFTTKKILSIGMKLIIN